MQSFLLGGPDILVKIYFLCIFSAGTTDLECTLSRKLVYCIISQCSSSKQYSSRNQVMFCSFDLDSVPDQGAIQQSEMANRFIVCTKLGKSTGRFSSR